jgi:hypothetical protein
VVPLATRGLQGFGLSWNINVIESSKTGGVTEKIVMNKSTERKA